MTHLDLHDGKITLSCSPRESDLARSIPGMAYDSRTSTWRAEPAWSVCKAARGVFGPEMEVGRALAEWSVETYTHLQHLHALIVASSLNEMEWDPALYATITAWRE